MEPQDTFDTQARMREVLATVFARRFADVPRVKVTDVIAATREEFPKQWDEWLAFIGPGAATHLPDFKPVRLAVDEIILFLTSQAFERDVDGFSLTEARAKLETDDPKACATWAADDPLFLEHELERLCSAGYVEKLPSGRYLPTYTVDELEDKSRAWQREVERLRAEAIGLQAEFDFLKATGHYDEAGRPRARGKSGKLA
jgi:hypothetical protein